MRPKRTPAWWWVRLELLAGISLTVLIASQGLTWTQAVTFGPGHPITLGPFEMPASVLGATTALVMAVVGLTWMVRIFRGPTDDPPPWRYRNRRPKS
jgi:hypothetical protein